MPGAGLLIKAGTAYLHNTKPVMPSFAPLVRTASLPRGMVKVRVELQGRAYKNTVIKLKSEYCGEILFILLKLNCVCTCLCDTIPVVVVQLYDKKADSLFNYHSLGITSKKVCIKVEITRRSKAFFLEDIQRKCMYVDGWLVPLSNTTERD